MHNGGPTDEKFSLLTIRRCVDCGMWIADLWVVSCGLWAVGSGLCRYCGPCLSLRFASSRLENTARPRLHMTGLPTNQPTNQSTNHNQTSREKTFLQILSMCGSHGNALQGKPRLGAFCMLHAAMLNIRYISLCSCTFMLLR